MLNPNTRVAVCGYAGDAHQVSSAMWMYAHHECPITILSPDDAPISIEGLDRWPAAVECRTGGKRQYIGQLSLDRQREHLRILLTYPEEFFLINDSDSMCLSPKIPEYLYGDDIVLWSNLINDNMEFRQTGYYPDGFPKLAFQPPYFMSRKTIAALLACVEGDNIEANPKLAFIDHYMVQLAVKANVPWANFHDGISCPISGDINSARVTWEACRRRGVVMIHSVKAPKWWEPMAAAHAKFLVDPRGPDTNPFPVPNQPEQPPPAPLRGRVDLQRQRLLQQTRRNVLTRRPPPGLKA
jgi:hypothetical protein